MGRGRRVGLRGSSVSPRQSDRVGVSAVAYSGSCRVATLHGHCDGVAQLDFGRVRLDGTGRGDRWVSHLDLED